MERDFISLSNNIPLWLKSKIRFYEIYFKRSISAIDQKILIKFFKSNCIR